MTTETKHTPGPWTCEFTACDKDGIKQVIAGDACFPRVGNQPLICVAECRENNARLIAAAPTMYDALKEIVKHLSNIKTPLKGNDQGRMLSSISSAANAIAKAEGAK